ncbi:hypothetical protein [Mycobacterium sp. 1274756.6]|uniref:hypothetical protein n=1 Tax=Mycobacterium sp. 1274756.6 TaxID=1834076 RepID=UPI0007FFB0EC|nr:hypothetical protein [Mycobacterium sp. 1274756.6]OBJ73537.1 hypothetical protein A5643_03015 [Mycobacterium sp. 1274756.6]
MTGVHPDLGELGPELRRIARAVLDGVDPTLRAVAAAAVAGDPGKCQQVWCPVCALAALAGGEQHPLLDVIAEHSVALLTVIRAMVDNSGAGPVDGAPVGEERARTGYQHIPVDVEE